MNDRNLAAMTDLAAVCCGRKSGIRPTRTRLIRIVGEFVIQKMAEIAGKQKLSGGFSGRIVKEIFMRHERDDEKP